LLTLKLTSCDQSRDKFIAHLGKDCKHTIYKICIINNNPNQNPHVSRVHNTYIDYWAPDLNEAV